MEDPSPGRAQRPAEECACDEPRRSRDRVTGGGMTRVTCLGSPLVRALPGRLVGAGTYPVIHVGESRGLVASSPVGP
jgi:hypothetical protein